MVYMSKWDTRGDPLLINHGVQVSGTQGGPFAKKKPMAYEQVGHKGGPFANKTWCMSKWDIHVRGDPLLKKTWCTSKWDIRVRGDPSLRNLRVQASGTDIRGDPLLKNHGV